MRRHGSRLRRVVFYLQVSVLLLFAVGVGGVVGVFISVSRELPKVSAGYSPPEVTRIYSSDDVLLATVGEENREFVNHRQIPKSLLNATVAIEDSRFFEHSGVDLRGIARAIVQNVRGGRMAQGGSTITQQLARNVYLSPKKSFTRKAREAVLAVMIERTYTKDKILELYMNQVYYGSGAFGVETASKIYFGKSVSDLNLSECALLAGLPNRPSLLSPHVNPKLAVERRNVVLATMVKHNYITPEERDKAKEHKPKIVPLKPTKYRSKAPYFTDYVKRYLRDNYEYGDDLLLRGGLRIYTTLDYRMQAAAQKALSEGVKKAKRAGQMDNKKGNGSLVCIEPANGYIRAMVGGEDYHKSEFNRAWQAKRQPGSSFKLFVYTAAVDRLGWDADTIVEGGHFVYKPQGGPVWVPRNYDGKWPGNMTMKRAVANSVNIPAIKTAMKVGLQEVVRYAHMMGINSEIQAYPAAAIGGIGGVSVLEMCSAYGVIASDGYYVEPTPIARVENRRGQILDEHVPRSRHILSERTTKVMDELFRAVVTSGTAYGALHNFPEARGKTGTTNEDADAWFIGYVPNKLVTAVWMGNDNHKPMKKVFGGSVCAPVWRDFMNVAVKVYNDKYKPKPPPKPTQPEVEPEPTPEPPQPTIPESPAPETDDDIEQPEPALGTISVDICDESGLLAAEWCPSHTETFVEGTQPTRSCNIHGPRTGTGGHRDTGRPEDTTEGSSERLRLTRPTPVLTDR